MKPFESVGKKTDPVPRVGEAWSGSSGGWLVALRGGVDVSY